MTSLEQTNILSIKYYSEEVTVQTSHKNGASGFKFWKQLETLYIIMQLEMRSLCIVIFCFLMIN